MPHQQGISVDNCSTPVDGEEFHPLDLVNVPVEVEVSNPFSTTGELNIGVHIGGSEYTFETVQIDANETKTVTLFGPQVAPENAGWGSAGEEVKVEVAVGQHFIECGSFSLKGSDGATITDCRVITPVEVFEGNSYKINVGVDYSNNTEQDQSITVSLSQNGTETDTFRIDIPGGESGTAELETSTWSVGEVGSVEVGTNVEVSLTYPGPDGIGSVDKTCGSFPIKEQQPSDGGEDTGNGGNSEDGGGGDNNEDDGGSNIWGVVNKPTVQIGALAVGSGIAIKKISGGSK